jgi:hypothetical protein
MIVLILASLTTALPTCAGKPKAASVGGDVYLLMQNGDVKRGAANTVRLLADSASLRQAMDGVCPGSETTPEAKVRAQMAAVLLGAKVAESATGVNAHYQFTGLAPGQYVLWAETEIGDHRYTWWAPIALAAGDSAKKDLDNSTEADHLVYCGPHADSVTAAASAAAAAWSVAAAAESVAAAARVKPLYDCYREARRVTTGYLEDRIAACKRKFGYLVTKGH